MSSKIYIKYENTQEWVDAPPEIDIKWWSDMVNRSLFPNDKWCLTCNQPESVIQNDTSYGHWNYCKCYKEKLSLGNLPPQPTAEFIKFHRRSTMRWLINFEFPVQAADAAKKQEMVVAYSNCEVKADTVNEALTTAEELLPQVCEGFVITGVAVVLES